MWSMLCASTTNSIDSCCLHLVNRTMLFLPNLGISDLSFVNLVAFSYIWVHVLIFLYIYNLISGSYNRISSLSFFGWRHWFWNGNSSNFQDQRGVSRPYDAHIFCLSFTKGIWHSGGAIQRYPFRASACWKCWWVYGVRQRSFVWYLLPHSKARHPYM